MLSPEVEVNHLGSELDGILRQVHSWGGEYHVLDRMRRLNLEKRHELEAEEVLYDAALTVLQDIETGWRGTYEEALAALGAQSLTTIWEKPFEVKLETTIKRGVAYLDIVLVKNGKRVRIKGGSGGSVAQVLGVTLRIIFTLSSSMGMRPLLVLDEPYNMVAAAQRPALCAVLRELSDRLGLQFLMSAHEDELMDAADVAYNILPDGLGTADCVKSNWSDRVAS